MTTDTEMVERVAQAMMASFKEQMGGEQIPGVPIESWAARGGMSVDMSIVARAAIQAMREPTDAMLSATPNPDCYATWQIMIDRALASNPSKST